MSIVSQETYLFMGTILDNIRYARPDATYEEVIEAAKIAKEVTSFGVTSLAHLSCISSTKQAVREQIAKLDSIGVENILALRGDIPSGANINCRDFHYAYELIDEIKKHGDFCIGGACYPECHPESESIEKDIEHLKIKVSHGCEFLTTQMFY